MTDLTSKHCKSCEGGVEALSNTEIQRFMDVIDSGWNTTQNHTIERKFTFTNYWQATAFVNAIAWIAHKEDHHPDIFLTYNTVTVSWTTHAINGLSENDFICAAKTDQVLENE